ncbi:MAG: hypothetical protein GY754_23300 [bacterium]|nr:hypothetical protein [bacterium]
MKYRITKILIPLILSVLAFGCLSYRSYPGGIEPNSSQFKLRPYKVLGVAEGEASSFLFFWVWQVTPRAEMDRAITNAVNKLEGDDLIDVRWWYDRQVFIVGTVKFVKVKGKVIKYVEE